MAVKIKQQSKTQTKNEPVKCLFAHPSSHQTEQDLQKEQ